MTYRKLSPKSAPPFGFTEPYSKFSFSCPAAVFNKDASKAHCTLLAELKMNIGLET